MVLLAKIAPEPGPARPALLFHIRARGVHRSGERGVAVGWKSE
jgi:hypothetical protein